ncbi:expressed unknown protein [Seminavis robusta]|uniref:Uncharacterized protein n=1 Tax=Seminavis robusta TaxID=568900 RepID=A0A9N8EJ20_9STRA|nr:expressed unknown protein [Seminavis robusta]|eukprot:Sro1013_g231311.1  (862) ;mRNA; r:13682-16267
MPPKGRSRGSTGDDGQGGTRRSRQRRLSPKAMENARTEEARQLEIQAQEKQREKLAAKRADGVSVPGRPPKTHHRSSQSTKKKSSQSSDLAAALSSLSDSEQPQNKSTEWTQTEAPDESATPSNDKHGSSNASTAKKSNARNGSPSSSENGSSEEDPISTPKQLKQRSTGKSTDNHSSPGSTDSDKSPASAIDNEPEFTKESFEIEDPKVILQVSMHTTKKSPKVQFSSRNVPLVNSDPIDSDKPDAFDLDISYTSDWAIVREALCAAVQEHSGNKWVVEDVGLGSAYFVRSNHIRQKSNYIDRHQNDLDSSQFKTFQPTAIHSDHDWRHILRSCSYIQMDRQNEPEVLFINLLCTVVAYKASVIKKARRNSHGESTVTSQDDEEIGQTADALQLPFGHDLTVVFSLMGPTSKVGKSDYKCERRAVVQEVEKFTLAPPFTAEELQEMDDDATEVARHRFGNIRRLLMNHALDLSTYKDSKGAVIVGEKSCVFIQPKSNQADVIKCVTTQAFWEIHIKKCYDRLSRAAKGKKTVAISVSIGKMNSTDIVYEGSSDVDDAAELTQNSNYFESPAQQKKPQSANQTREQQMTSPQEIEDFIWKNHASPESPWYHSFTLEHYQRIKICLMAQTEKIYQRYSCIAGDLDTWPPLSELPSDVTTNGVNYGGRVAKKGAYPPESDVPGSYKRYKLTADEQKEQDFKRKMDTLTACFQAGGATTNNSSSASNRPATFTIRFYRDNNDEQRKDVTVPTSPTDSDPIKTLGQAFDSPAIRRGVRSNFKPEQVDQVRKKKLELVVEYINSISKKVYRTYTMEELATTSTGEFYKDVIPRISSTGEPEKGSINPVYFKVHLQKVSPVSTETSL